MDPETQKQQFRMLVPSIICLALMPILKLLETHVPWWIELSLYVILTTVCIANAVRFIRWRKRQDL
jgi:hypothetical protein